MMKHLNLIVAIVSILIGSQSMVAQSLFPDKNDKDKYGYIDRDGNMVLKYEYKEAGPFVEGKAKVCKGDKWGYINESGKEVIPLKYSDIDVWNNGYCRVAVGGSTKEGYLKGAKYGIISQNGDYVLKPEYDEIGPFKNGL